ncbi:hypothetical protein K469DRAFT_753768 [Zopfia rhizophila CBS 207.26]|uniref:Uncharacterized protein n=1 Tax=Zopfia rhizophila CBS 207.26 TaxID=1314779 RepID=A0A6A6DL95_9PEZI|nr:hypothetical protein K469DRAFT_753768 [Zopfia rhizophila CBS 207.26]
MPSNKHPKKLGGRPRKHFTAAAAIEAKRASDRRRYRRTRRPQEPADFIAYEPPLHTDIPTETPPEIGLRTSIDVPIHQDDESQRSDTPQNPRLDRAPPAETPVTDEGADIDRQIRRLRADKREPNIERDKYEAGVPQRLDEMDVRIAEILLQMRLGRGPEDTSGGDRSHNLGGSRMQASH